MNNNEGMKKILFILLLVPTVSYSLCLGIFKDKDECEAMQAFKKDVKVCSEKSWSQCKRLEVPGKHDSAWCGCIDRVRKQCMREIGGWDDTVSACYDDD